MVAKQGMVELQHQPQQMLFNQELLKHVFIGLQG